MHPTPTAGCVALVVAAALVPAPAFAAGAGAPGGAWALPFLAMLLAIALFPLLAPRFWHRRMGLVTLLLSAALVVPHALVFGLADAAHGVWHAMLLDYVPFVTLLLAMFAVGGGILLEGGPWGTPRGNTALMALATLLAGVVGPLATSTVLIHPLLRANAHRRQKVHLVVFFIVLVCNVGGLATPLGNPPLYIGLLQGVPFAWPLERLWPVVLILVPPLLVVFRWFDGRSAMADPLATPRRPLHLRGVANIGLLALLMVMVLGQSSWRPGDIELLGVPVGIERLLGPALFVVVAVVAVRTTPRAVRQANMFNWAPMREVAILFAGIFVTITPVLAMMNAGLDGPLGGLLRLTTDAAGQPRLVAYFWLSGILSAFLDNAPTYFLFFQLAGGDPGPLTGASAPTLMAISAGSVCFGALTYIGNAPNMVVRAIAAHRGVRMPGFFRYMAYACALLLPGFALLTLLFFR